MTGPKLLPCPFCGSATAPKIVGNGIGDYYVRCDEDDDTGEGCGARTSDYRAEHESVAAKRWNMRASPSQTTHVEAERERCAKIAEGIAGTISAHWKYPEAIAKAIRAQASPLPTPSQD